MSHGLSRTSPMLRHATRCNQRTRRCLHSSARRQGSPFFALAALSNSRETQHFAKLSKLSRIEHSPTLKLIESSEVLPFASPSAPPVSQDNDVSASKVEQVTGPTATTSASTTEEEADLLSVGRAILAEKDAKIIELERKLHKQFQDFAHNNMALKGARFRAEERVDDLSADLNSNRFWKRVLLVVLGSAAAWTYLQEGGEGPVKRAWNNSSVQLDSTPVRRKPQRRPVPAPAPAPAPATIDSALVVTQQQAMPQVTPTSEPATSVKPPTWQSIFWARS